MLRKMTINKIIIVLIMILLFLIIFTKLFKNGIFIVISLGLNIMYLAMSKKRRIYNLAFKENIIKTFVKEYSEKLEYKPLRGIGLSIYAQAGFERFDRLESEDLITGVLDDRYIINIAEVKTKRESTDENGNKSTYTVFHGMFANVKLDKTLNTVITITKNRVPLFEGKQKIEMDSGEFEKIYNVYTSDKIAAMQLLTADVMQILLDLKKENKLTPEITIKGNDLYIRFLTGEVFEGSLMANALDYSVLKKYYDIINFTLKLIECFSKNISETEV